MNMIERHQFEARAYGLSISREIKELSDQIDGLQERAFRIANELADQSTKCEIAPKLFDACMEADQELKRLGQILNHVRVRCEKIVLTIAPIEEKS